MSADNPKLFHTRAYRDTMEAKIAKRVERAHRTKKMRKYVFVPDDTSKPTMCDKPPKDADRKLIPGVIYKLTQGAISKYLAIHANNKAKGKPRKGLSTYRR